MTKPLPFTAAGIARAIKGVEKAGRFVLGVRPDGVLIVGDKPIDTASFVPVNEQPSPAVETRRMGEYFNGGAREA
jgi:hypothetical protein